MNNNEFLSQDEINEIVETKIDNELLEKVKKRKNNILWQTLMKELLKSIEEKLEDGEAIEFYISGRDYTSDSIRLAFAATIGLSGIAHPVIGWSFNCILVRTNRRFFLVEVTGYLQYSRHYEIQKEVSLFKEKEYFYLTVEDMEQNRKTIQYHIGKIDMIMNLLKDNVTIINGKKMKSKAQKIIRIIQIAWILYLLYIIFLLIKNWNIIFDVKF
jgi:hypothetical protein